MSKYKPEYTKEVATIDPFQSMRNALLENEDNLLMSSLSEEQAQAVKRLMINDGRKPLPISDSRLLNEMAGNVKKLWGRNKSNLNIFFFDGTTPQTEQIFKVAQTWCDHCRLKFILVVDKKDSDIRVSITDHPNSWSVVGTDASLESKDVATMNLGGLIGLAFDDPEFNHIVLHEFGHALGLEHEHQGPEFKFTWNKPFVYNYFFYNYQWPQDKVDKNILNQYDRSHIRSTPFDEKSIMTYHLPADFTMEKRVVPKNYKLSDLDKQYIGELYKPLLYS